jgi:hypothetical protein
MGYERLIRLARLYGAQVNGRMLDWSQWERERRATVRFLWNKPLAVAEFNDTIRRYRMDEPHALSYEAWLTFLSALKSALEPVCDAGALSDALAASRGGQA